MNYGIEKSLKSIIDKYINDFCVFDEKRFLGGYYLTIGFFDSDKKFGLDRRFDSIEDAKIYLINEVISISNKLKEELTTTENK